ncbi:MAG: type II secretion system protein [Leptolyngbya sp. SIOISBB]|nr:type II secretion system protein [Leptolyngbya sp. SIOISBB]
MQYAHHKHHSLVPFTLLRLARLVTPKSTSHDAGLTLVECVMAIVVVGLMGTAIAPMMVASVATRVQSQKAEQALELAQGEIDRVRIQFEQNNLVELPITLTVTGNRAPNVSGPSSLADTSTTLREVDVNNDTEPDFVIQSYLVEKTGIDDTYEMGVRVYDYNAVANNAGGALAVDEARLGFTDSQGERSEKPISVLYTNLGLTEEAESLCNWIDYTDSAGTATKPATCN